MKKQQIVLIAGALVLLSVLFFLGTNETKKETTVVTPKSVTSFNIEEFVQHSRESLTKPQFNSLSKLENELLSEKADSQKIETYSAIADFWKDSVHQVDLYAFYVAKTAKLVNSEKNLTFAAQLMLDALRNEQDAPKRNWKAEQAIELFEKAIEFNPNDNDLKVGLGSCYIFGRGMTGEPDQTMKGIQQVLQVVKADSTNMKAQLVLGIGGVISSQFDKAILRLQTVVNKEPDNIEAVSWLADAYAGKGDKENALKWYEISKRLVNNPEYTREVNERIKMLK